MAESERSRGEIAHVGPMALKLRPDLIEGVEKCLYFTTWKVIAHHRERRETRRK